MRALGCRIDGVCGAGDYPQLDLPREASRSRSAPEKSAQFGPDRAPFHLTTQLRASLDAFAAVFRIFSPSWLGLAGGTPLWTQFVGIIPPIVCINMAIRTYENKSFF